MISNIQNSKTRVMLKVDKLVKHANQLKEGRNKMIHGKEHISKCLKEMRTL